MDKACSTCGVVKPLAGYPLDASKKSGLKARCKPCESFAQRNRQNRASENPEAWKLRKQNQREKRGEEINEYHRERYAANADEEARKQNDRRQRREPHRLVRSTAELLRKGSIGIDESVERIGRAIAYSDQIPLKTAGEYRKAGRPVQHRASKTKHGDNGQADSNKSESNENTKGIEWEKNT